MPSLVFIPIRDGESVPLIRLEAGGLSLRGSPPGWNVTIFRAWPSQEAASLGRPLQSYCQLYPFFPSNLHVNHRPSLVLYRWDLSSD